jgi:hypothetical protein
MNGRKCDVLIEDRKAVDPRTGIEVVVNDHFVVWADENKVKVIKSVEGVLWVCQDTVLKTRFYVYYDQRYDREYLKREIEAAVLCSED